MIPFVFSFLVWAVLHSITAAQSTKSLVARLLGESVYQRVYRAGYTFFSLLSFLPVAYFYLQLPDVTLWQILAPWAWVMYALQLVGAIGAAVSVWQTDALCSVGVRQLFGDGGLDEGKQGLGEALYIAGLYRWMRHPLYTFSMMFLWFNPTMSRNLLLFNVLATFYFTVGSIFEERRLVADFGSSYIAYQARVPRFLPRPWQKS